MKDFKGFDASKLKARHNIADEEVEMFKKIFVRMLVIIGVIFALYFWGFSFIYNSDALWKGVNSIFSKGNTPTVKNTLPPTSPRPESIPVATKSAELTIRGKAEIGNTIKIFANDFELQKTIVDSTGDFIFDSVPLVPGVNRFFFKAINNNEIESKPSRTLTITFKDKLPKLEVTFPINRQEYTQKEAEIKIAGKTEPDASIKVNDLQLAVDDQGVFQSLYALSEGENKLRIVSEDVAGNRTVIDRVVFFHKIF